MTTELKQFITSIAGCAEVSKGSNKASILNALHHALDNMKLPRDESRAELLISCGLTDGEY